MSSSKFDSESQSLSGFTFPLESLSCMWSALHSYCLAGKVFFVEASIDLEELGQAVASDDNAFVAGLLEEQKIWKAHYEETNPDTHCTFVIVQPFIFVGVPS